MASLLARVAAQGDHRQIHHVQIEFVAKDLTEFRLVEIFQQAIELGAVLDVLEFEAAAVLDFGETLITAITASDRIDWSTVKQG